MPSLARSLDGRPLALALREGLAERIAAWPSGKPRPGLVVIAAGADPGSARYRRSLAKQWQALGGDFHEVLWPDDLTASAAHAALQAVCAQSDIHGVLLQMPMPEPLQSAELWRSLDPAKDVEGVHPLNLGRLWLGADIVAPCTAAAVMSLLHGYGLDPSGLEAVVVGRSPHVGKAIAHLLTQAQATVTLCHSRTRDLDAHLRRVDLIVSAAGRPGLITAAAVRPGAIVIDVATQVDDSGRLIGDVDPAVASVAGWLSPVPGGVGPLTVAMLLRNVVAAAHRAGS